MAGDAFAMLSAHVAASAPSARHAPGAHTKEQLEQAEARRLRYDVALARGAAAGRLQTRDYDTVMTYAAATRCFVPHRCSARGCNWRSLKERAPFSDPRDGRAYEAASGLVFLCATSGAVHVCDDEDCRFYVEDHGHDTVCGVSRRSLGGVVVAAAADARRDTIRAATSNALADQMPPGGGGAARRPLKRKEAEPPAAARASTPVVSSSSKRRSALQATRNAGKRFAPGSAAAAMVEARGLREADVTYGAELVRFALENVSDESRASANKWVAFLLFSGQVQKLHTENFARALASAEEHAERYATLCANSGRIDPARFRVHIFGIYYPTFMPLVDRALWIALSDRSDYVRIAEYFTRALIALWKITESTPCCCEVNPYPGSPTEKRQRAHSHLEKFAVTLLYMLKSGARHMVAYDRATRLVLSEADKRALPVERIAYETITYVPAHRILGLSLPEEKKLSKLNFTDVLRRSSSGSVRTPGGAAALTAAAHFEPNLVQNTGWINDSFRSLTSIREPRPLTIDQVLEYRLTNFVPFHDLCPNTARFVEIT